MHIPRFRNVLLLKNSLVSSTSLATQFSPFHSSPSLCQKWKNKSNSYSKGAQQPSKNHIRYATHAKRADTKKALKDLLYKSGSSKFSLQDENLWKIGEHADKSDNFGKKQKSRSFARHADKSHQKKVKRKFRRDSFTDDYNDRPELFQAKFGNKWYTWSFNSRQESFFQESAFGFHWRDHSSWENKNERWRASSDEESDNEPSTAATLVSSSDRTVLGLPPTGPLKMEDVKKAFHLSALKWHPDKHQGPSQAMAEEKFKLCVNAYKSLRSALSPA